MANRLGVLPEKANDYLSPLLMRIITPCMVFSNIAGREIEDGMLGSVLAALLLSALYFAIFTVLGWFICVRFLKLRDDENCGIMILLFASINNGFMGFPITLAIFGEDKLFYMVFFQMSLMIFLYGPGIALAHYGEKDPVSKSRMLAALGPGTIASILGLIVMFLGIKVPDFIFQPIDIIGDATTPVSMIVIGIQLGSSNFSGIIRNKKLVSMSVIKMALTPLITFLMVNWLPVSDTIKIVFIFGAAFPSAVAVTPIASMEGKDASLAAEGVALTTLMSLITLPVAAAVLTAIYM